MGRTRRSWFKFAGLFALCFVLMVSCGRSPQSTTPISTDPGRITIGTTLKVTSLDPADAYGIFPGILLYNLGDRLYTYKPGTTELVPQLATAMPEVSVDGLTYKIPLRSGVTFHDGTPLDAEAMAFSLKRFVENGGGPSFLLSDKIESVNATGASELTIKLKSAFAGFPALLTFSGLTPVSPKAYTIGNGKFQPKQFVGTGPYKLSQLSPTVVRLDANENYWGEKPQNKGIDIQILASSANLYNTFRTGGLDIAYQTLNSQQIRDLQTGAQQGEWQVIEAGANSINYLTLNQRSKPLDNLKVRQAIAMMVDRNLLNERVFQGQAEPLYSLLPNEFPHSQPVFKEQYGDGNFEKAKTLLTEAGFSAANPLVLDIWYSSTSEFRRLVGETLKASIEQKLPGLVKVNTNTAENATLIGNLEKGIYPITLFDWYPDFYDADTFLQPFLSCDKGSVAAGCEAGQSKAGGSFYFSDRANQLIKQQRGEANPEARGKLFTELQELLAADVPYIPVWQNKDFIFAKKNVQGMKIEPTQQIVLGQIKKS